MTFFSFIFVLFFVSEVALSSKLVAILQYPKKISKQHLYNSYSTKKDLRVLDEENKTISDVSKYTWRTSTCGELNRSHVGRMVTLCGWLEYQRLNKFAVLRDGYGQTQLIVNENSTHLRNILKNLPYESVLEVEGKVKTRPPEMINEKQITGEIEIEIHKIKVLNEAKKILPFNIRDFQKAKEPLRMQYRYLDMRFTQMQLNLRTRSELLMDMRYFLCKIAHFVDVETPTLFKASPGGAQEFVVPTRFPGLFYSLVQSPQQFKQMLMGGAIDRYFQIARCYRDESSTPDRQPEFTQLDIEISFTNIDGVIKLIEELLRYSWPKFLPNLPDSFPRITYTDAMELYGSDKPDMRYDYKLKNCSEIFFSNPNLVCENFQASYIAFNEPNTELSKNMKEKLEKLPTNKNIKFIQTKITSKENWIQKYIKLFGEDLVEKLWNRLELIENSVLFLSFGNKEHVLSHLGKVRVEYVNYLEEKGHKLKGNEMRMLWVTDFPLFEKDEISGELCSVHHPFTAPNPQDEHLLNSDPLRVRALSYDLVLNGNEIGGGSIRVHDRKRQEDILKILKIDQNNLEHMLEMLSFGCPPHGGIALGLDRLLSIILNTPSIRDVIAFPKTFEGRDPISGAPSLISEESKKLYHIEITK